MAPIPTVDDFADAARDYCSWVEGDLCEDEAHAATLHIAQLNYFAQFLSRIDLHDVGVIPLDLSDEGVEARRLSLFLLILKRRFRWFPFESFSVVCDPFAIPSEEPAVASVAGSLSNIWNDLKDGLEHWSDGRRTQAEYIWRESYPHWGKHLTEIAYALHAHSETCKPVTEPDTDDYDPFGDE